MNKQKVKKIFEFIGWFIIFLFFSLGLGFGILSLCEHIDKWKDEDSNFNIIQDENNLNKNGYVFPSDYLVDSEGLDLTNNSNFYYFSNYFDDNGNVVNVSNCFYNFDYIDIRSFSSMFENLGLDYSSINLFGMGYFDGSFAEDFYIEDGYFPYYCFYTNSTTPDVSFLNGSNRDLFPFYWNSSIDLFPFFDVGITLDLTSQYSYFCIAYLKQEVFTQNNSYNYSFNISYDGDFYWSFSTNPTHRQYDDLQNSYDDLQSQYDDLIEDGLYQGGYNDGYDVGKSDGYDESLQRVYANNPFYNARLNYYFTLSSSSYAYTKIITDVYLDGSTFIQPGKILQSSVNANAWQAYVEDTQLGYYELIFSRSWSYVNLAFLYQCNVGNSFDYALTFYCDDGTQWTYHNPQYVSNNDNPDYFQFVVDFSNNLNDKMVNKVTWRRQYSYEISTISNNEYQNGFVVGSQDGYAKAYKLYDDLQTDYDQLDYNYNTLLGQYNTLLRHSEYSFSELFWSISSVPFGVLTSAFNVQVLGVNLRGVITGLFTAALLIWLFKKFFK